jgi:hypothetical protein
MNYGRIALVLASVFLAACSSAESDVANEASIDGGVALSDASNNSDAAASTKDAQTSTDTPSQDASVLISADAMADPCAVSIRSVSTPDLNNLAAGAGLFVRLRGEITGNPRPVVPDWQWRVTRMGQDIATTSSSNEPSLLRVPLEQDGRYLVTVNIGMGCKGQAEISAAPKAALANYIVLRLIPPQNSLIPAQDSNVKVIAGVPGVANVTLAEGKTVRVTPQRNALELNNQTILVPAAIRISNSRSSFLREGRSTAQSSFTTLLGPNRYDVLIVPEDNQLPPFFEAQQPFETLSDHFVNMTPGVKISGRLLRNGVPIVGARIMLRKDQQPSTIGQTDAAGRYSLRARKGRYSLRIVGPSEGTWPTVELPSANGIDVPEDGASEVSLLVNYANTATASLDLKINLPGNSGPAAGASVELSSQAQNDVASVSIGNATPINAAGKVVISTLANGLGLVNVSSLPRAIYTVKIRGTQTVQWTAAHLTTVMVDLRAGDGTAIVDLTPAVTVTGKLNSTTESPSNLRVVAINESDVTGAPEASAEASADGTFALKLSPQSSYRLRVDPPLGRLFPRVVFGSIATEAKDIALSAFDLPKTLRITGRIANAQGSAVGGTIVQAFCTDLTVDCIDLSNPNVGLALPLSEAVAGPDGQYVLVLPDPGSN